MKKVQSQLKSIAKSLSALSKQIDSVSKQLDKAQPAKKSAPKKKAPAKKAVAKKPVAKKASPARKKNVLETVLGVIKRSRKGVSIPVLKDKTNLDARQLSNALYKLSKRGDIASKSRGIYIKK